MTGVINRLIKEAKEEKRLHTLTSNVPSEIDCETESQLIDLLRLLEPFAQLTDALQGDGVTSSLAIPCLIDSVLGIMGWLKKYLKLIMLFLRSCRKLPYKF